MNKAINKTRLLYVVLAVVVALASVFALVRLSATASKDIKKDVINVYLGAEADEPLSSITEGDVKTATIKMTGTYTDDAIEAIRSYFKKDGGSAEIDSENSFANIILVADTKYQVVSDETFSGMSSQTFGDILAVSSTSLKGADGKLIKNIKVSASPELIAAGKTPVITYKQGTNASQSTQICSNYTLEHISLVPNMRIGNGYNFITLADTTGSYDLDVTFGEGFSVFRNKTKDQFMTVSMSPNGISSRDVKNKLTLTILDGKYDSVYFANWNYNGSSKKDYASSTPKANTIKGTDNTLNIGGKCEIMNVAPTNGKTFMDGVKATVNVNGGKVANFATLGSEYFFSSGTYCYDLINSYVGEDKKAAETVDFTFNFNGGEVTKLLGAGYKEYTNPNPYVLNGSVSYVFGKDAKVGNLFVTGEINDENLDAAFLPVNGASKNLFTNNANISVTYNNIEFANGYNSSFHDATMGGTIKTVLNNCKVTGDYVAGEMISSASASAFFTVQNVLTDTEITGNFIGGVLKNNLGYKVINELTHATVGGTFYGVSEGVGVSTVNDQFGSVTNTIKSNENGKTVFNGDYYGASKSAAVFGTFATTIDGAEFNGDFYGVTDTGCVCNGGKAEVVVDIDAKNFTVAKEFNGVTKTGVIGKHATNNGVVANSGKINVKLADATIEKGFYALGKAGKFNAKGEGEINVNLEKITAKSSLSFYALTQYGTIGADGKYTNVTVSVKDSESQYFMGLGGQAVDTAGKAVTTPTASSIFPWIYGNASITISGLHSSSHIYAGGFGTRITGTLAVKIENSTTDEGWLSGSVHNYGQVLNRENKDYALTVEMSGVTASANWVAAIGGSTGITVNGNAKFEMHGVNTISSQATFDKAFAAFSADSSKAVGCNLYCGPRIAVNGINNFDVIVGGKEGDKTTVYGSIYGGLTSATIAGDLTTSVKDVDVKYNFVGGVDTGEVKGKVDVTLGNATVGSTKESTVIGGTVTGGVYSGKVNAIKVTLTNVKALSDIRAITASAQIKGNAESVLDKVETDKDLYAGLSTGSICGNFKLDAKDLKAKNIYGAATNGQVTGSVDIKVVGAETSSSFYGVMTTGYIGGNKNEGTIAKVYLDDITSESTFYGASSGGNIGAMNSTLKTSYPPKSGDVEITVKNSLFKKAAYGLTNTGRIIPLGGQNKVTLNFEKNESDNIFYGALGNVTKNTSDATKAVYGAIGASGSLCEVQVNIKDCFAKDTFYGLSSSYLKIGTTNYYANVYANVEVNYDGFELTSTSTTAKHLYAVTFNGKIDGAVVVNLKDVKVSNGWLTGIHNYSIVNNAGNKEFAFQMTCNGIDVPQNYVLGIATSTTGSTVNGNAKMIFCGKNTIGSQAYFDSQYKAYCDEYLLNNTAGTSKITSALYCGPRAAITSLKDLYVEFADGKDDLTTVYGTLYLGPSAGTFPGSLHVNANNIKNASWDTYAVTNTANVKGNADVKISNCDFAGQFYGSTSTGSIRGVETLELNNVIIRGNFEAGPWSSTYNADRSKGSGITNAGMEKVAFKATYNNVTFADRDIKWDKYATVSGATAGKVTPTNKEFYPSVRCGVIQGDVEYEFNNCKVLKADGSNYTSQVVYISGSNGGRVFGDVTYHFNGGIWSTIYMTYPNATYTNPDKTIIVGATKVYFTNCQVGKITSFPENPMADGASVTSIFDLTGGDVKTASAVTPVEKITHVLKTGKGKLILSTNSMKFEEIDVSASKTLNMQNTKDWTAGKAIVTFDKLVGGKTLNVKDFTEKTTKTLKVEDNTVIADGGSPYSVIVGETFTIRSLVLREDVDSITGWGYTVTDAEGKELIKKEGAAGLKKKTVDGVDYVGVDITGINAADFDKKFTLTIVGQGKSETVSVNDILQAIIKSPASVDADTLTFVKALFNYGVNYHNKYCEDKQSYQLFDVTIPTIEDFKAEVVDGCDELSFVGTSITIEDGIRINLYGNIKYTGVNKTKATLKVNDKKIREFDLINVDKEIDGVKCNFLLSFKVDTSRLAEKLEIEFTYRDYTAKMVDGVVQYCKDAIKLDDVFKPILNDILAVASTAKPEMD